ncbi:hypothetical protein MSPP1_001075 [Malassezia sp. CBS 17886]|nr:hypothetical protein MSPP1_001075 [Malassezia sp. CBS 17886]
MHLTPGAGGGVQVPVLGLCSTFRALHLQETGPERTQPPGHAAKLTALLLHALVRHVLWTHGQVPRPMGVLAREAGEQRAAAPVPSPAPPAPSYAVQPAPVQLPRRVPREVRALFEDAALETHIHAALVAQSASPPATLELAIVTGSSLHFPQHILFVAVRGALVPTDTIGLDTDEMQARRKKTGALLERRLVRYLLGDGAPALGDAMKPMQTRSFYHLANMTFNIPANTGQSYSFTSNGTNKGFWEQAIYEFVPNPQKPECHKSQLIWQHGNYTVHPNTSLTLTPFSTDGRIQVSDPCSSGGDALMYYTQCVAARTTLTCREEFMRGYFIDVYIHYGKPSYRLQLYQFDGSLKPAMYLTNRGPEMFPTMPMHKKVIGIQ